MIKVCIIGVRGLQNHKPRQKELTKHTLFIAGCQALRLKLVLLKCMSCTRIALTEYDKDVMSYICWETIAIFVQGGFEQPTA